MGRRDAVQFTLELVAEWRRPGARVTFEPGWETRGNGTSADYEGAVVHHTASASSDARPFPTKDVLRGGRSGLPGPLCNSAGPRCTEDDPWIHVMAAHPANHAGASGGRSMGPLPVTRLFNPRVWGHEIDYAGTVSMTRGQYLAALIAGRGVANVLARSTEYVRAHAETSITGKWDPGYANGKTIDMAAFRRDAWLITRSGTGDFLMALSDSQQVELFQNVQAIRSLLGQVHAWARGGDPNVDNFTLLWLLLQDVRAALIGGNTEPGRNNFHWSVETIVAAVAELLKNLPGVSIDPEVLRAAIAESVTFTQEQLAEATADEIDRRDRDGDPATGSVS